MSHIFKSRRFYYRLLHFSGISALFLTSLFGLLPASHALAQSVTPVQQVSVSGELAYTTQFDEMGPDTQIDVHKVPYLYNGTGLSFGNAVPLIDFYFPASIIAGPDGSLYINNFNQVLDFNQAKGINTAVQAQDTLLGLDPVRNVLWMYDFTNKDLQKVPLNPISNGIPQPPLSSNVPFLDQLAFDPAGNAYYISDSLSGNASLGTIDLNTFTVTPKLSNIPAK